jgi:hypothetical protein
MNRPNLSSLPLERTLESATKGSNPDIVIKHRFDKTKPYYVKYLIDHNGKDKSVTDITNDHDVLAEQIAKGKGDFGDYMEYAARNDVTELESGVASDLTPTFTKDSFNLKESEIKTLQEHINVAADNHNLMWKTVVSFSDDFLIREGLMDNLIDRNLDQQRIKEVIQKAMPDMLKDEGINESAEWFADIHLHGDRNKNHVHVHIATFEQQTNRPDKFNPVTHRMEPKGLFKQKTIVRFKAAVWRDMQLDENREKQIELMVNRGKLNKEMLNKVATLEIMRQQTHLLNTLIRTLPDEKETKWRAKSNAIAMKTPNALANKFINRYLETDGQELLRDFITANSRLQDTYQIGMGKNKQSENYVQKQRDQLQEKLVNRLYHNLRVIDPELLIMTKSQEIAHTPLEENQQIKILLEQEVELMKTKGQTPPKLVTKELGLRKRAIRLANLAGQQEIIQNRLDYQKQYNEDGNLELLAVYTDDPLISYVQNRLIQQDYLLTLEQMPSYKLTTEQKNERDNLTNKYCDISETPINFFSEENVKQLLSQRTDEINLIKASKHDSIQIAYGLPDIPATRREIINKLNKEINIIQLKGTIVANNAQLLLPEQSKNVQQELKQKNSAIFGRIAMLEGRKNKFEVYQKKIIEHHHNGRLRGRKQSRFRGRRFNMTSTRHVVKDLSYAMANDSWIERSVHYEYEREQERREREMEL